MKRNGYCWNIDIEKRNQLTFDQIMFPYLTVLNIFHISFYDSVASTNEFYVSNTSSVSLFQP